MHWHHAYYLLYISNSLIYFYSLYTFIRMNSANPLSNNKNHMELWVEILPGTVAKMKEDGKDICLNLEWFEIGELWINMDTTINELIQVLSWRMRDREHISIEDSRKGNFEFIHLLEGLEFSMTLQPKGKNVIKKDYDRLKEMIDKEEITFPSQKSKDSIVAYLDRLWGKISQDSYPNIPETGDDSDINKIISIVHKKSLDLSVEWCPLSNVVYMVDLTQWDNEWPEELHELELEIIRTIDIQWVQLYQIISEKKEEMVLLEWPNFSKIIGDMSSRLLKGTSTIGQLLEQGILQQWDNELYLAYKQTWSDIVESFTQKELGK